MPYVITTRRESGRMTDNGWKYDDTRVAVATLEDARLRIAEDHANYMPRLQTATRLSESGGTIGPLPDGTIIEVKPVSLDALWEMAGSPDDQAVRTVDVIAAFNAS